jgi:threonine synthase
MESYLKGLQDPSAPANPINDDITRHPVCPTTGGFQEAVYDLDRIKAEIDRDAISAAPVSEGIWRWRALLPVRDPGNIVSLIEGNSPVVHCSRLGEALGFERVFFLDESRNPTGSFKDRGASVTVSKCKEVGVAGMVLASSGNAATSFCAYTAKAGIPFYGFMRRESSDVHKLQSLSYGQKVFVVEGDMVDGTRLAQKVADAHGFFHCTQPYNLYRAEGKKTAAYEICEALGWHAPDRVLIPTAGGTNALAFHKAFRELLALGWIESMPAIDIVQSAACAPIHKAWTSGEKVEYWLDNQCRSVGLGHPFPSAGDRVVEIMHETGGRCWLVEDMANYEAARRIAHLEGLFLQPASASPASVLAGLPEDTKSQWQGETVVCIGTGSGKNQTDGPLAELPEPPFIPATLEAFDRAAGFN